MSAKVANLYSGPSGPAGVSGRACSSALLMTVYVDNMFEMATGEVGRMRMSHMIADTDDELHAMADLIGVARRWHQAPPLHDSHYDVSLGARGRAVASGAVEISMRVCAAMVWLRRAGHFMGSPGDALARWAAMRRPERVHGH